MSIEGNSNYLFKNTSSNVVLPFYLYASLSFMSATIVLFFSSSAFIQHYFHPHILAITHLMALGWGTMIILGASHQLLPVLIEGRLFSQSLAYGSFVLAAVGVPLLVYGFYKFDMGWPSKWGGRLIFLSVLCYLINTAKSLLKSQSKNVHAIYVMTAALWLLFTATFGLVLVYNYSYPILSLKSVEYLPLHAHTGIIGWFLLLVIGVGSRLIPMFLISNYSNIKLLWIIYALINTGLLVFVIGFLFSSPIILNFIPVTAIFTAIFLFGYYCRNCYLQRIRKQVDDQIKFSLLSVIMMFLPLIILFFIIGWLLVYSVNIQFILTYGFAVFFGWITIIIFGMTFKTLPFIVWNKIYHLNAGAAGIPNPKNLFNSKVFILMVCVYLTGFVVFIIGVNLSSVILLKSATVFLLLAAILYNWNVIKILLHKPVRL